MSGRHCLGCAAALPDPFLDLGAQPLANAFIRPEDAGRPEPRYPLAVAYCAGCHLVQLTATAPPEVLFGEYLYFTSYSDHFLAHARAMAGALERFALGPDRGGLEIASNNGYLLRFPLDRGVPVLGVEPARIVAAVATPGGILPWNLPDEIVAQQAEYLDRGGAFIVAMPTTRVIDAAR